MNTQQTAYTLTLKVKDANFSIDYLEHYHLLLQAGTREFQLIVVDGKSHRCLLLEHYDLPEGLSDEAYVQLIKRLFEEHHLLMAGFWKSVKLSIKNQKFTLVPAALFDKDHLTEYLRLNCYFNPTTDQPLYYRHTRAHIVTVFTANKALVSWLNERYPNLHLQILHHAAAYIEGLHDYPDHSSQRDAFVLYENNMLTLAVMENQQLLYCNMFFCPTEKDALRYLMLVYKQFQLNQNTTKTILFGQIKQQGPFFSELRKYIANLSFGLKPRFLNFRYMFDEVPDHRFFDLYSTYLCE